MKETMEQERAEAIRSLELANQALARIFNVDEGEDDEDLTIDCDYCGAPKGERCYSKCKGEGK
jgi:hypothetical protein